MLYKALFLYNLEPSLLIQTVHTKQTSFSIPNKNYWFWLFLSTSFQTFLFLFSSLPNHQDSSKLYPEGGNLKVKESILWPSTIFEYKKYNYQTLKVYTIGWGHHGSEMEITIQTTLCQKPKYKKKNKGKEKHRTHLLFLHKTWSSPEILSIILNFIWYCFMCKLFSYLELQ